MADLRVAACRLDAAGRQLQAERYRGLSPHVTTVSRDAESLRVAFEPGVDLPLLRELVAVERDCCPFLDLRLEERRRALRVAVADPAHRSALDAVAAALDPKET